jgi:hypothetical protein
MLSAAQGTGREKGQGKRDREGRHGRLTLSSVREGNLVVRVVPSLEVVQPFKQEQRLFKKGSRDCKDVLKLDRRGHVTNLGEIWIAVFRDGSHCLVF